LTSRGVLAAVLAAAIPAVTPCHAQAQGRGGGPTPAAAGAPPASARAAAPKDLTGYWVSVVAEHWHLRMMVPPKGDFTMLPLNAAALAIAGAWDPSKEEPGDAQCKAYGAATIMRVPGRLHIQWADDNTLEMEIDSGTQTRLFHFGAAATVAASQPPSWQGYSAAEWEGIPGVELRARKPGAPEDVRGGLKVMTSRLRAGYLRRNGVPYSGNTTVEEHFDRFREPNGDDWIVVDTIIRDPQYLTQPYVHSVAFKKLPNASGWDPTPCRADQPR
jgi:hypothetical protein